MSSIVLENSEKRRRSIPESNKDLEQIAPSEKSSEHYIVPPDGGRGWVIVFSCFMV